MFGRAGLGDDRTNPLQAFLSFGMGGSSPLACRPADTFGVGWYWAQTSDRLGPIIQTVLGPIGDGNGVELFYNYAATPWCHITPDIQIIDPAVKSVETTLVLGVRASINF